MQAPSLRLLRRADALADRLAGWRGNPLYQTGTIAVTCCLVLLVTGLWLLLFYRIGAPWASVARITDDPWLGNWVRGLHRIATDVALLAVVVHLYRMFAQRRSWGPRTLAWLSGIFMLGLLLICGWTGYVMVWDVFGEALARDGARVFDRLPVLSEPVSRIFTGETPVLPAFFFINLFLHVALPLGLGLGLWLHVSRIARPALLPPRRLMWTIIGLMTAAAVVWPMAMAPEADPLRRAVTIPIDVLYAPWLVIPGELPAWGILSVGLIPLALLALVPWLTRPREEHRPAPSTVDEALCTGCTHCAQDCPWEAITMLPRTDGRAELVARVDPTLCVSCGLCAGSCAPMGVGPPGRTGRDQLEQLRRHLATSPVTGRDVVVIGCARGGAGGLGAEALRAAGARLYPIDCVGNLHTSVIEFLVRGGAGGVLVLGCPPRDCWNREGPRWIEARMYHGREAELQDRVDRRRVHLASAGAGEPELAVAEFIRFQAAVDRLLPPEVEPDLQLEAVCETALAAGEVR